MFCKCVILYYFKYFHKYKNLMTSVISFLQAFAVCSIVFVIYRALKWCSYNIELINKHILYIQAMTQQKGIRFRDGFGFKEQLMKKRDIYIRLRLVCAVYTMVFAIVTTMATFLTEYAWVRELTFEVPEVLVFTALGITFRLRDFRRYENIEIIVPREKSVVMFLPYPDMYWPKRQKIAVAIPLQPVEDSTCDDEDKALLKDSWVIQRGHAKREAHTKASIKACPRLLNQLVIFDQHDSEANISESRACLEMDKPFRKACHTSCRDFSCMCKATELCSVWILRSLIECDCDVQSW